MNVIEFARNLFTLRMERRMTIEDLAEALDVTPETICQWECAKTSPSLDNMNKLAKIYGIPLEEIIRNPKPRKETPVPPPTPSQPKEELPTKELPTEPETSPAFPRRAAKKKRTRAWEIIVILLLLAVISAALFFLFQPDLFPLSNLKVAWTLSVFKQYLSFPA